jgi:hypothetical protein
VAGGYLIETTGVVAPVYVGIGLTMVVLALIYNLAPTLDERSSE